MNNRRPGVIPCVFLAIHLAVGLTTPSCAQEPCAFYLCCDANDGTGGKESQDSLSGCPWRCGSYGGFAVHKSFSPHRNDHMGTLVSHQKQFSGAGRQVPPYFFCTTDCPHLNFFWRKPFRFSTLLDCHATCREIHSTLPIDILTGALSCSRYFSSTPRALVCHSVRVPVRQSEGSCLLRSSEGQATLSESFRF